MLKELLLVAFSIFGFAVSFHIWNKVHKQKKKLVCVIGDGGCDEVVKSKYGHMFGIDNTIIGMVYYSFILVLGLLYLFYPSLLAISYALMAEKAITGLAAAMSVVLTIIQFAVLRKFCEYCTIANAVNIAIFLTAILL
ncbi:MAG: vitamin K epoxide reductase family protein [Nanoarchaeota archaeon]